MSISHEDKLSNINALSPIECGEAAASHFSFDKTYTNLNHGSYGTIPTSVRAVYRSFQDATDARPDPFIRYNYRTHLLNESREALAEYLAVPSETCVLVPNASTAFETVMRNLNQLFTPNDAIIYFANIYDSFENTLTYLSETSGVSLSKIQYIHPVSDAYICTAFEERITHLKASGKTPRLAVFDTVTSLPATRMPFETLTSICRTHAVLSCIDGAHGIGQFPLHLSQLDPDFLLSNCHKWLHVPRPCAVLYVPLRNQHYLRSTLPVGVGFVAVPGKPEFVRNFASVGTSDDNAYLCIQAALAWRGKVTWEGKKGEEAVMGYIRDLAQNGGKLVADILQTEILENQEATLSNCGLVNIRLPLSLAGVTGGDTGKMRRIAAWMMKVMTLEHETAVEVYCYNDKIWVRLCAQVYLTLKDFEHAGKLLQGVCERVKRGETLDP